MWRLYVNYIVGQGNVPLVDILGKCNNLSWGSDADTLATTLAFDSLYDLAEGRTHVVLKKDSAIVFMGVIVSKTNQAMKSSYTAMDYAFYLNKNKLVIQFNNTPAKQAIKDLCKKFDIKTDIANLTTPINAIYKDSSISDIILDILSQCQNELGEKYIMEMQGDTLYIAKLTDLKLNCKLLIGRDYSVSRSMEDLKNRIIITSNSEDARVIADVQDTESISTFGQLAEVIQVEDKDIAQAKNIAQNNLALLNRTKKELTLSTVAIDGGEIVKAKRMIQINLGKYGINGWYKIKAAEHKLANSQHSIGITIDFS
ncbi:MAG: hypothetical protein AB7E31_04200 [Desulfitobacterium sp.]